MHSRTTGKTRLRTVLAGLWDDLEKMSDAELAMLLRRCRKATTTNCGWDEYAIAPLILGMTKGIITWRKSEQTRLKTKRVSA